METSRMSVHLLLRSICTDSGWNYAAFWKPRNQNCMMLTCSEAYHNFPESPSVNKAGANSCFYKNEFNDCDGAVSGYCGSNLQLTIANVSRHAYSLKEGVISQIVMSGKHHWVLAEKDTNFVENSELSHELPDEWKIQFAAGIKTIVLVPVMPYGLVQLGSLSTMREDVQLVDHIRSLFIHLHLPPEVGFTVTSAGCMPEMLSPLGFVLPANSGSSSIPCDLSQQKSWETLCDKRAGVAILDADQAINGNLLHSEFTNLPMLTAEDDPGTQHSGLYVYKFGPGCGSCADEKVSDSVPTASIQSSHMQNWDMEENSLDLTARLLNDETQLRNTMEASRLSICDTPNQKIFAESLYTSHMLDKNLGQNMISNVSYASHSGSQTFLDDICSFMSEECAYQLLASGYSLEMVEAIADDTFKFPDDSELHKALGQTSCQGGASYFCNGTVANLDGSSSRSPTDDQFNLQESASDLLGEIKEWLMDGSSSEHLLDAMVADVCISPENKSVPRSTSSKPSDSPFVGCDLYSEMQDNVSASVAVKICQDDTVESFPLRSTDVKPSTHIQEATLAYHKTQADGIQSDLLLHDLERWSYPRRGFFSWSEESATMPPPVGPQADDPKRTNPGSALSKNEVQLPKSNKKRSKPGESGRPRPRDRQQIQDRIKELREIVPEGAKCSIDALFERTIKHMLFLRSVTNHVDKLKKCARPKVSYEDSSSLHSKGATWAVELGSQSGSCPLIVENLSHPGHVLVEMLCEDQGLFLEIAQVIRNLGITILKGLTETREDKMWAHFIIEVSKGFQRMDILWPLMQLFQPRHNATISKF